MDMFHIFNLLELQTILLFLQTYENNIADAFGYFCSGMWKNFALHMQRNNNNWMCGYHCKVIKSCQSTLKNNEQCSIESLTMTKTEENYEKPNIDLIWK